MANKYVDMMKKNRIVIFETLPIGTYIMQFIPTAGQTSFKGAFILNVQGIDNSDFINVSNAKYIGSFEMESGELNASTLTPVYGIGDFSSEIIEANNKLSLLLYVDSATKDVRVDIEFMMPGDDYMAYDGYI